MTNFKKFGNELNDTEAQNLIKFHIALEPKYPNDTFIRHCVTMKPPPNAIPGADEQKVS